MSDAFAIEIAGRTVGLVARESGQDGFKFFASSRDFNAMEGDHFPDPTAAERAARHLAKYGSLPAAGQKPTRAATERALL